MSNRLDQVSENSLARRNTTQAEGLRASEGRVSLLRRTRFQHVGLKEQHPK